MRTVYADNNATTPAAPEVVEAMQGFFTERFYNPGAISGQVNRIHIELAKARRIVAEFLGASDPSEIAFTSGATESNNWAIFGSLRANKNRQHIIASTVEHPSVLETFKTLNDDGYDVTFIDVDKNGNLDVDNLIDSVRSDTNIISLMAANNETGVMFPVKELSAAVKQRDPGIIFHTDGTQYIGKFPVNLQGDFEYIDLLSFSGHKIHGPKGVGGLFIRKGTKLAPLLYGGQQESGHRSGTENVPGIIGLAKACELAETHMEDMQTVRLMRDHLEAGLLNLFPSAFVNGDRENRLPNTLNIAFDGVESDELLHRLQNEGVSASNGSACSTGSLDYSHVLRAMKVPYQFIAGSVRFSLSRFNTIADVDTIIEKIQKILSDSVTSSSIGIT